VSCQECEDSQVQLFAVSTIVGIALGAGVMWLVMKRGR